MTQQQEYNVIIMKIGAKIQNKFLGRITMAMAMMMMTVFDLIVYK